LISDLWIERRKKEIAIRKAFGYKTSNLFTLLFKDFAVISIPAVVLAFIFQITYQIVFKEKFLLDVYFLYKTAAISGGILFIVLWLLQRVIGKARKIQPVEWLRRAE